MYNGRLLMMMTLSEDDLEVRGPDKVVSDYDSGFPCRCVNIRTANLYWILSGAFRECSWWRGRKTGSYFDDENTSQHQS